MLTEAEHEAATIAVARRKTKFQAVLYSLFMEWMNGPQKSATIAASNTPETSAKIPSYSDSEARAVQALVAMMRAGDPAWPVVEFALSHYMEDTKSATNARRRK
jgi:hypothetical protein